METFKIYNKQDFFYRIILWIFIGILCYITNLGILPPPSEKIFFFILLIFIPILLSLKFPILKKLTRFIAKDIITLTIQFSSFLLTILNIDRFFLKYANAYKIAEQEPIVSEIYKISGGVINGLSIFLLGILIVIYLFTVQK